MRLLRITGSGIFRLAALVGLLFLGGCQGNNNAGLLQAGAPAGGERPVQLLKPVGSESGDDRAALASIRQPVNEKLLAKAIERYRLNKKQKASPYRSVGVDLNSDGQPEALVLLEGDDWCARTGCTLAIFSMSRTGYRPVATIRRVWSPVTVARERHNGWSDLVVKTGLASRNQHVRLRFGARGYPGNAVTLTPMPADIEVEGEVVIEGVDLLPQELVSNVKP